MKTIFQLLAEANGISTDEGSVGYADLQSQLDDLGYVDAFPPSAVSTKITPRTITQQFVDKYPQLKTELEIFVQVMLAEVQTGRTSTFTVDSEEIKAYEAEFKAKFLAEDKTDEEKGKALQAAIRLLRYKPRAKSEGEAEDSEPVAA